MEFLWPFLLIIFIGIIVALVIQFVFSWLDQREIEVKNKIYFYLDEGQAEILPWGETEWTKAYHGQLVLEGDRLAMKASSRGILEFYNGTLVRLDESTKLNVEEISSDEQRDTLRLDLQNGTLWMNVSLEEDVLTPLNFIISTDHLRITSYGTIFEVGLSDRETVRVLEGEVLVEIFEEDSDREVVLEQVKVGVGQQIELTAQGYESLVARQSVSLLEALDDPWKESAWAAWNKEEDAFPTAYALEGPSAEEETSSLISSMPSAEVEAGMDDDLSGDSEEEDSSDSTPPELTLTFPEENPYPLPEGETSISLTGTTSANTAKVVVTSYDASGVAYAYTLTAYTAGSTTWRYNAASAYDNLREGRNLFTIVAENVEGVESEAIEVVIQVPEGALETEIADEASESDTADEGITEEDSISDGEETSIDATSSAGEAATMPLATPQLTSLNSAVLPSSGTYTTSAESVLILGSVSTSAVAVYVNDYQLSQFEVGSGVWSYYAQPDFLNYDVGENVYTVYAEDAEGNVSEVLTFKIYREAP